MPATPEEQVRLHERRHAVVLAGSFVRSLALAFAGLVVLWLGWPFSPAGAALLALGALLAVRAVWRWERTLVVVTSEKLFVVDGTLRRRAAAVRLSRVGAVELEQTLPGRTARLRDRHRRRARDRLRRAPARAGKTSRGLDG